MVNASSVAVVLLGMTASFNELKAKVTKGDIIVKAAMQAKEGVLVTTQRAVDPKHEVKQD